MVEMRRARKNCLITDVRGFFEDQEFFERITTNLVHILHILYDAYDPIRNSNFKMGKFTHSVIFSKSN